MMKIDFLVSVVRCFHSLECLIKFSTTFIKAREATLPVAAVTVGTLVANLVPVREREVSVHTLPSREAWLLFQQASHQRQQ